MKLKHLAAALALAIASQGATAQAPKREFRSIWMAAMGIDWPRTTGTTAQTQRDAKQELIDYLDNFKKHNFTGVCIHVRPMADALYKSSYEPWSVSVSGKRGTDPGWDPLAFAVEECHKRGMECYAWVNPYRIDNADRVHTTPQDKEWREKGWTMYENKWTVFNPAVPAAREHCMKVMEEIWTNYQIDGMLFDDYFYPGNGMSKGEAAADYQHYLAYKKPIEEANKELKPEERQPIMSIEDWRRNNVNTFVKELYDRIQAQRPDLRFGIGPAGVGGASAYKYGLSAPNVKSKDWMYNDIFCDPLAWLNDGSIDFIAPQIYWSTTRSDAPFGPLCEWWDMVAKHFGRHNYVSMASYRVDEAEFGGNNAKGWAEMAKEVEICRNNPALNAPGQIYYSAKYFDGPTMKGLGNYLEQNSYTSPALVPVVDWKNPVAYGAPAKAAFDGTDLKWNATKVEGRAIMRYTVYAVPLSVRPDQAEAMDGDGIDGQYLLGVTYSPSYTIPEGMREGYWYAVCAYDGYGIESAPAYVNYEGDFSAVPVPTTPADGATVAWDAAFAWTGSEKATFKIQIASDAAFRKIVFEKADLTKPEITVDLGSLEESTKYFWRVFASEPQLLTSMSDTFAFMTPARSTAATVTLKTPAPGSVIDTPDIVFSWTPVAGVDTYYVQVAKGSDFSAPIMDRTVDATLSSLTVRAAAFGIGDFSWRVVADGQRVHPSTSAAFTFKIEKLDIGANEPGYEISLDQAKYDPAEEFSIESLWMRTVDNGKMSFEANGGLNRTIVATPDRVYVSGRSAADTKATSYLSEYSAETGEHLRDITLGSEASVDLYPCNGVIKDSKNNICIHNLTTNCAKSPLVIHAVNTVTGELTEIARLTTSEADGGRIDHAAIYGDINSDQFCVFAALASKPVIVRWTIRKEGNSVLYSAMPMADFYPTSATHFGIAPMVYPVNERSVYVDGGSTFATCYNLTTKKSSGTFATSTDAAPVEAGNNGMARFSVAGKEFFAYSSHAHSKGVKFNIARMNSKDSFKDMHLMWNVPADGLGKVNSTTCAAPVEAVNIEPNTAHVYTYSPGNGLAAYRVTYNLGAVDGIVDNADNAWHINGLNVVFDRPCSTLAAFTLTGATVTVLKDADCITLPCAGTYIIATERGNHLVNVR
ncbi:MAG: family 10 glycosylhydrolase [Muribaculaceae bacterium]|nr:family 10 glycosylhydrolase [Muribaculaceae bacterium]